VKVKCPVIEDLLPLYIDGICSIESKIVIEEHLKECKICNDKYNIQKSNMILDNNAINENLKSKEPFKKIKKYQFIKLIIILLSIPLIYLSLIEIRGDGVGFSTLYGKYTTNRFLSYIEKEEFVRASKY
jgi:predicted anti-sigma-YlaC factor YlaD